MKFTPTHEWVKKEKKEAIVGITLHAAKEIGEIVNIELPQVGKKMGKGETVAILESTKSAIDISSPLSGEITAVNSALTERPELLQDSPEEKGWLFKMHLSREEEYDELMSKEEYQRSVS